MKRSRDDGFTVSELMVTLLLLSIISVILFNFIDNITETTTRASKDVQAETDAQLLLRRMSEDIRAAQDIATSYPGTPTCPTGADFTAPNYSGYKGCLSFSIYRPTSSTNLTCPRTVATYGLVGTELRASRQEFNLSGGTCSEVTSKRQTGLVLMTDVVNSAGQPLFTYLDRTGNNMLSLGTPANPIGAATVRVTVVKRYRKRATDLVLTTNAALRNQR